MSHLSDDELLLLLAGEPVDDHVRAHLRACVECETRLAAQAQVDDALFAARAELFSRDFASSTEAPMSKSFTLRCENCGVGLSRAMVHCPACGRAVPGGASAALAPRGPSRPPVVAVAAAIASVVVLMIGTAFLGFDGPAALRPKGVVVVTVTGAVGGTVRFDDREPVRAEPSVTIDRVRPGTHSIVVEEPGMIPFTTQIVTTKETPLFPIKAPLRHIEGRIVLSSDPPGATVFIDGRATDHRTPATLEVEGNVVHALRLELAGHVDDTSELKVAGGETLRIVRRLAPQR